MSHIIQKEVVIPHFSLPFRFGGLNGGAIANDQDTEDDIVDCVKVIIAYPIGSREDLPEFGIPDLVFKQSSKVNASALHSAVQLWEPRSESVVTEKEMIDIFEQHYLVRVTTHGE